MVKKRHTLLFAGDLVLGAEPERYMAHINGLLDSCDFRMAQLEEPYLDEILDCASEFKLTSTLEPLVGRIDLLTLAGNHFYDYGEAGVTATVNWCDDKRIAHCGGGVNITEAKKPAFVEKDGLKIGVLAFNAVGSKYTFATDTRGGVSYVNFTRAYIPEHLLDQTHTRLENDNWDLKKPVHMDTSFMGFNFIDEISCDEVCSEIAAAKEQCDLLIVYFHKGRVHQPSVVTPWEKFLSHRAIDNGADVVVASHSHLARGVELYKGRAIYHGLNNFICYVPQLSPLFKGKIPGDPSSENEKWVMNRVERFGFVPDPDYLTYPFHPESIYCPVAKLVIENGKIASYRLVLLKVEKDGIPRMHGNTQTGREILKYIVKITEDAGLNARYKWEDDDVVVY